MKRNDSDILIARNFLDSSGIVGKSGESQANWPPSVVVGTPAQDMDAHVQGCIDCQGALNVPSPRPECVCRLCPDGLAYLIASLSPSGVVAARAEIGGVQ